MMIVCAGVSLVGGVFGLSQTDNMWCVVPFAIFAFLFCLSLISPEIRKAELVFAYRVVRRTLFRTSKGAVEWLSALGHYGVRYVAQKRFEMARARHAKNQLMAASPGEVHRHSWFRRAV